MIDILSLRKQYNLSQDEFAKILGVSRPTLSDIEQGKRGLKKSEIEKLSQALEMSIDELDSDKKLKIIDSDKNNPYYKFKQVLLYITSKCAGKPNVGKTVLNKLLYFCDFDYYEKHGESITNVQYIKNLRGPVPEVMDVVIDSMIKRNEMQEVEVPYYGFKQIRLLPLVLPDLSVLSAEELSQVDEIIVKYSDKSADWLTNRSHGDIPRKATQEIGERISYGLVMYRDDVYAVSDWKDD